MNNNIPPTTPWGTTIPDNPYERTYVPSLEPIAPPPPPLPPPSSSSPLPKVHQWTLLAILVMIILGILGLSGILLLGYVTISYAIPQIASFEPISNHTPNNQHGPVATAATTTTEPTPRVTPITSAPTHTPIPTQNIPTPTPYPTTAPYSSNQIYNDIQNAGLGQVGSNDYSMTDCNGGIEPAGGTVDFGDVSSHANMSIATLADATTVRCYEAYYDSSGAFITIAAVHHCVLQEQSTSSMISQQEIDKYKTLLNQYCI